ncbi:uncharacterized protein EV154DRAFT_442882 [Mucor mucedo]|uniref:uncharacterized protein n=1 Tax=Mucor mucedo TaxID=29922 RepID=UPI00221FB520|nr:uncharacterized protein EV154DRAFT_442882 [Mucor mucedo]KAI7891472.1 hypothetical protein EV154DRAFT_442882 [Mucor mucedo]
MSSVDENANNTAVEKIKSLSMFLRKVAYNAQLFVNFYILKHPNSLPNELLKQNFWYSVCRVVYQNLSVQNFQSQYPLIPHLAEVWDELNGVEGVNLTVDKGNLTLYGQVVSSACESIATCYNNYYIENFENIIANYFIYMIRQAFHDIKMPIVKHIVYEHVLNVLFSPGLGAINSDNISTSLNSKEQENICTFLNPLILEIKNRIPAFPVTKATLNNAPFSIMPVLKHILEKYESLIVEAPLPVPVSQLEIISQEQSDETDQVNKRPRKKKKVKKYKNDNNGVKRDFQPPRLFSLFPNPGLHWRFVKIDSQNLTGLFPTASMERLEEETVFEFTQRYFFARFNFAQRKGRMFINSLYTDGYTCRISFCRKAYAESPVNETALELQDFNSEEIDRYFRPCTVDPNRKDAFVSFHGNTDVRRLSSAEYYNMNGSANRMKLEQDRKKEQGVQTIETNIPSVKSAVTDKYITHVKYMMQHKDTLFSFYNFQTARVKWCNYIGKQRALQDAVNILINGSKKYNKGRRKKTRKNKRKRSKTAAKYQSNTPQAGSRQRKSASRSHKEKFEEGDKSKMPLIIFGDGLKNKSHVKISGIRHGVSEMIYRQLKLREKLGELLLLDIDEYKTSKVKDIRVYNM